MPARSGLQQVEQLALLAVIGTRRVAERWPDAAVALGDQLLAREALVRAVAPVAASARVKVFGERFGEAVGERLDHDRVIVVVVALERRDELGCAVSGRDGEGADEVADPAAARRDEIRQRQIAAPVGICSCWRSMLKRNNSVPDSEFRVPGSYRTMSSPSVLAGQKP